MTNGFRCQLPGKVRGRRASPQEETGIYPSGMATGRAVLHPPTPASARCRVLPLFSIYMTKKRSGPWQGKENRESQIQPRGGGGGHNRVLRGEGPPQCAMPAPGDTSPG